MPLTRFIPVDTGNTLPYFAKKPYSPVYPRGYGEHDWTTWTAVGQRGLSPWIRGTRRWGVAGAKGVRFIPVDTGNT